MMEIPVEEIRRVIIQSFSQYIPLSVLNIIIYIVSSLLVITFVLLTVLFLTYLERKVSARMQSRIGPLHVGPQGLLQAVADAVKLLVKGDVCPAKVDRLVYLIAPVAIIMPAFLGYAVIPFGQLQFADLNIGLLFIFAVSSFTSMSILIAGWGSNNKYSLLGGIRSAAQDISYEIPLILSVVGVIMLTGSLSLKEIVSAQSGTWLFIPKWFVFLQPFGFLMYIICANAETNRTPFDLPEAESELVAGYHTEYSGMKFSLFFLAEYANLFLVSSIAAVLFLGGGSGPILPSYIWYLIKAYFMVIVFMWFRWTFPRLRIDQLMNLGWKVMIPLALLNILLTGIVLSIIPVIP